MSDQSHMISKSMGIRGDVQDAEQEMETENYIVLEKSAQESLTDERMWNVFQKKIVRLYSFMFKEESDCTEWFRWCIQ